jgi:glutathione S-transferase
MIVHGSTLSPFVRKVVVFAAEKGVALENRPGLPGTKTPEFLAMSPFGKIPAFEDGDYKLCDSTAIVHYIEAKHPEHPLIPAEAKARGKTIWYDEYADTIFTGQLGLIFFHRIVAPMMNMPRDLAIADRLEADVLPVQLAWLEGVVPSDGFLVGDSLSLADISVASPFINMDHAGVRIDAGQFPRLTSYLAGIHARPSYASLIAAEKKMLGR